MTSLIDLAAKVEALSGPCRETDREVAIATRVVCGTAIDETKVQNARVPEYDDGDHYVDYEYAGDECTDRAPEFTDSLDAAMMLVPEEMTRLVRDASPNSSQNKTLCYANVGNQSGESYAQTMPLALTAAALRARAFISETDHE